MRIVITGATGFIGRVLCQALHKDYELTALSRNPQRAAKSLGGLAAVVQWDGKTPGGWQESVDGALAVINLAGENIGSGRWTKSKKTAILQSRLDAAHAIIATAENVQRKPAVVVQASGVGYYGDRSDEILDEGSSLGTGFLADVAKKWEAAIEPIQERGVRLVTVRLGVVLGPEGGLIPRLLPVFRFFLGGHPGSGRQWLSWIHIDDVTAAVRLLIENKDLQGPFNLTSPNPVLAKDFYRLLGQVMHRPAFFPLPAFGLKLLMGQMATELLLAGQRAVPKRLLQARYEYRYPDARSALEEIIGKPNVS
ncbi:MAG: TIGR01777 family oxidoreductase [Planctomycetota bacterium]|jgi:uncharacterized protein (TIGR01777 family)